ncbi:helix-turn-helix domain-containing protein [Amaricoccus sp. W119]|uniref:helix-turn-helix domain-containing protein n=1 Tax=Amaricoccus sp. W119 TaxID=3391833 RepID=UPI0039A49F9E
MEHIATAAGRPIGQALPNGKAGQGGSLPNAKHRWRDIFDPVTTARAELALNATDLAVLRAILSYLPGDWIHVDAPEAHVCFASNRAIADRVGLSGDSTVNRALRKLEAAGIVQRRASANHKRYPRRTRQGEVISIYGISLAPAFEAHDRVLALVQTLTARANRIDILRARCADLIDHLRASNPDPNTGTIELVNAARKQLRRVPTEAALSELLTALEVQLYKVGTPTAEEMKAPSSVLSDNDNQIEQHKEAEKNPPVTYDDLRLAFPTVTSFTDSASDAREFEQRADILAESLPDTASAWRRAKQVLTFPRAYILLGYALERGDRLRRPGAYIHALTTRCARNADLAHELVKTSMSRLAELPRGRSRCPC